jgi:hypothetical protein
MGEANRRRACDTLDGGEPSDDRIVLMVDVFDPMQALLAMDDAARLIPAPIDPDSGGIPESGMI